MTKTIRAVFDGKTFVPENVAGVPVGFEVQISVPDNTLPDDRTAGQRLIDEVAGCLSWEEGEAWLQKLYAGKKVDIDLQHQQDDRCES